MNLREVHLKKSLDELILIKNIFHLQLHCRYFSSLRIVSFFSETRKPCLAEIRQSVPTLESRTSSGQNCRFPKVSCGK